MCLLFLDYMPEYKKGAVWGKKKERERERERVAS